jgi:glycosyltransferase involved in cell wall biosynthesis
MYAIEGRVLPHIGKNANRRIAISNWVAKELVSMHNLTASTIYPGINTSHFKFNPEWKNQIRSQLGINDSDLVILFIGRLHKVKDPFTLLSAMRKLRQTNTSCKLLIVGSGELQDRVMNMINSSILLRNNVIWVNSVAFKDVAKYYSASDIFVLPSIREGFGYATIEAMAAPLPVVVSNVSALPEVVGDCGEFFQPGDSRDLTSKLKLLLNDPDLRNELAYKGFQRVQKLFRAHRMVNQYVTLYQTCMKAS